MRILTLWVDGGWQHSVAAMGHIYKTFLHYSLNRRKKCLDFQSVVIPLLSIEILQKPKYKLDLFDFLEMRIF